jgi:hypothetical protein
MKSTHFALVLALVAPAAACSGQAPNVSTQTAEQVATKAPLSVQVEGHLRRIADAFAEVPLRPDQRAEIESLMTAANQRHQTLKPIAKDVMLLLADQIEKGAIDESALQPKIDAAVAAFKPVQAEDRKAIQRAHDILDKSQREALVGAIEAKHHERFGGDDGEDAGAEDHHRRSRGPWGIMGMGKMAQELDLTPDQRAKIFDAVRAEIQADHARAHAGEDHPRWREWREHRYRSLAAFKKDDFQIDRDMPAMDPAKGAQKMVEHGVRLAKVALPILSPDQRAIAAKLIREHLDEFGEFR